MENEEDKKISVGEKIATKLESIKIVKALSNPGSTWTLPQEILQDIQAGYTVSNPNKRLPVKDMVEDLKKEIDTRYADDEEMKKALLDSLPTLPAIRGWTKKDGWEDAVWKKIKGENLFSPEKRAQVIEALRDRAMDKSDAAAKIWLTLSGDYSEKMEVNDKTVDTFREINSILHKKKTESDI